MRKSQVSSPDSLEAATLMPLESMKVMPLRSITVRGGVALSKDSRALLSSSLTSWSISPCRVRTRMPSMAV